MSNEKLSLCSIYPGWLFSDVKLCVDDVQWNLLDALDMEII